MAAEPLSPASWSSCARELQANGRARSRRASDVEGASALGAAFKAAEDHLEHAIRDRFGIKAHVPEIKRADRALLATERRAFSAENRHWPELEGVEPLDLELAAWPPDEAAPAFEQRYAEPDAMR